MNNSPPPQRPLRIVKYRDVLFCDFLEDAPLPEFRGPHPVVVVSTQNRSGLPVLVIPLTSTQPKGADSSIIPLEPSPIKGRSMAWAVTSHVYAVSADRLSIAYNRQRKPAKLGLERMKEIIAAMALRLPLQPQNH